MATKDPVMIIQELGTKNKCLPTYKEEQIEAGPPPKFGCTLTFHLDNQVYQSFGEGGTKKQAKKLACDKMLKETLKHKFNMSDPSIRTIFGIKDDPIPLVVSPRPPSPGQSVNSSDSVLEALVKRRRRSEEEEEEEEELVPDPMSGYAKNGNPIADLKNILEDNNMQEEYKDGPVCGPPNQRIFAIDCEVEQLELKVRGCQRTKKAAKRVAAEKMKNAVEDELKKRGDLKPEGKENSKERDPKLPEAVEERKALALVAGFSDERQLGKPLQMLKGVDDFMSRSEVNKLRENEFAALKDKGGPRMKVLLEFSALVNKEYPVTPQPLGVYEEWLISKRGGIKDFYKELKDELGIMDEVTSLEAKDQCLVILKAEVPGLKTKHPVIIKSAENEEKATLAAMVDLIMFIGLQTVS